ncbi:MAG TPA: class I SAM-dependent methyltransferase [Pirellulales bacterium]|nr:class I SAM-dependent methyltransferase [Pirellulales bacterium]
MPLARVLEPEVMDSPQEAVDYDAMDHSTVNRLFVDDFLAVWQSHGRAAGDAEILDLGTGTAQIPIELLRRDSRFRVVGIDLAESMLGLGRQNVSAAGFCDGIRLEKVDAKHLPYVSATFAAVISNSIVHHIPDPREVLSEASRVLDPDGILFVRDLLRPDNDATVAQLVEAYAAGGNDHQRQLFAASLRAALRLDEIREIVHQLGHDPVHVRQTSDRHWTWATP